MNSQTDNNLVNQYLLATPAIQDPLFESSVVFMCEHSEQGSMGVVINHVSDQNLQGIFQQLNISCDNPAIRELPVHIGGPVKLEQGFVLHTGHDNNENSLQVGEHTFLSSSRDMLESIAHSEGPEHYMVLLGYSGWSAGQLEQELQGNAWLTTASDNHITFHNDNSQKWQLAFDTLGFNLDMLSPVSGNA